MYEHYIRPQECGNRFGVRYAEIETKDGLGISFTSTDNMPFCFKALHYDTDELDIPKFSRNLECKEFSFRFRIVLFMKDSHK